MVLWDTSPPSSPSAGFLNKVAILCPNNLSLDLLACREASSTSLDFGLGNTNNPETQHIYPGERRQGLPYGAS